MHIQSCFKNMDGRFVMELLSDHYIFWGFSIANIYVGTAYYFYVKSHPLPSMSNRRCSNMLHLGTGAQCSVLLNYLRPSKILKEIHPNFTKNYHMEGIVTVKRDTVTSRWQTYESVFFSHPDFPGLISSARRYVRVNKDGDPSDFWGTYSSHRCDAPLTTTETTTKENDTNNNHDNINISIFQSTNHAKDIANIRNQGFKVDNDNKPVPENIPIDGTVSD